MSLIEVKNLGVQFQTNDGTVYAVNDLSFALERGQTLAQMAVAWCLHKPEVNSVIIGTSSVIQLQDNIDALKNADFSDDELWKIGEIAGV